MSYKLGISVIVKDEIRCIRRLIDTLKYSYAHSIVIIDTGSTDGTCEYLKKCEDLYPNIQLHQFEWTNFSDMRNISFDILQHNSEIDFVLTIDADEWFEDPEDAFLQIHRVLSAEGHILDTVHLNVKNYLPENQSIEATYDQQIRIVHLRPEIRWENAIHNQIVHSIMSNPRNGKEVINANLVVTLSHDGYALKKDKLIAKFQPRVNINKEVALENKETKDEATEQYYWYQYIKTLHQVDNILEIDRVVKEEFKPELIRKSMQVDIHSILSNMYLRMVGRSEDAEYHSRKALEVKSDEPMALMGRGQYLYSINQYEKAYNFFIASIIQSATNPNRSNDINIDYIMYMMMLCMSRMGVVSEAIVFGLSALKHLKPNQHIKRELKHLASRISLELDLEDDMQLLISLNENESNSANKIK
jgi:glycosyltransferase involved in cell wall biosynthesis